MQRDSEWARRKFLASRVGHLATVGADGHPHVVPIGFAVVGPTIVTAVDAKPKSGKTLRRLANIEANPWVSVLVDRYEHDWTRLWWARADGPARVLGVDGSAVRSEAIAALCSRYEQYRAEPPAGPVVVIDVRRWSGWSAAADVTDG